MLQKCSRYASNVLQKCSRCASKYDIGTYSFVGGCVFTFEIFSASLEKTLLPRQVGLPKSENYLQHSRVHLSFGGKENRALAAYCYYIDLGKKDVI
jgi:hypothetical protein